MCLCCCGLCCTCCCRNCNPKCFEITILVFNVIFVALLIWAVVGLSETKFTLVSSSGKTCYTIGLVCTILTLIMNIVLIVLRCLGIINTTANIAARILCISIISLDILTLVLVTIGEIKVLVDMVDIEDKFGEFNDYFLVKHWVNVILPTTWFQGLVLFHVIFASFLLRAIWAKTDKSFDKFKEDKIKDKVIAEINKNQNTQGLPVTSNNNNVMINQIEPQQETNNNSQFDFNQGNSNLNINQTTKYN